MNAPLRLPLTLGQQGRVVIPAEARAALGLKSGDRLSLQVEDGRLVIESLAQVMARIRAPFRDMDPQHSLVDELIAERRADAARE